jgi:amidase
MLTTANEPSLEGVDRRTLLAVAAGAAMGAGTAAEAATDIPGMTAVALAGAIRTKQVSCVEVMRAYLAQIARLNPRANAIVALQDPDDLLKQAAARDADLAGDRPLGLLHGFPHAFKDLQPAKGIRFTQGSPVFKDTVATVDSLPVERVKAAGAIVVGKTNTPEFGLGSNTFNPVYGITRNACDPTRTAGGSSGGAAVALALDMVPVADGSDYGGSLRNPAGWNNVYGFRTTIGRVPLAPREVWLPSMGVNGPMARNVGDLALLLSVQAGFDPRAPLSMDGAGDVFRTSLASDLRGRRIAWAGDFGGAIPNEPGVLDVCRKALKTFEAVGCVVEEAFPDYPVEAVWQAFIRLRNWQQGGNLLALYKDPKSRALLKPEAVFEVESGAKLSAYDVTASSVVRTEWTRAVAKLFERYDYLVLPTAQVFPFAADLDWPKTVAGRPMRTYHEWMQAVCLITMSGCPALATPAGFNAAGLPMGIQIVAPQHRELACLKLAAAYEGAAPKDLKRRPPALAARGQARIRQTPP